MNILEVKNLSKAYRTYSSEWKRMLGWFNLPVNVLSEHWILRDVNFSVTEGQCIAIVGQNGCGKSTLLKMIAGTLKPSSGNVHIKGEVAALLELGMGFNLECTGRQNVLYSAGLMGYNRKEIDELMPAIKEFSEVGEYFDEPMRTYSTGMQVRVAFAVATAKRPQILIVDEALAVGDAYFQQKSFNKICEFQKEGTTLLIVTHDQASIKKLCNRVIFLDNQKIIADGEPTKVLNFYNKLITERHNNTVILSDVLEEQVLTKSSLLNDNLDASKSINTVEKQLETITEE